MGSEVVSAVSPTRQAFRRVRRDRSARLGAVLVVVLVLIAIAAPLLAKLEGQDPYTYNIGLLDPLRGNAPRGAVGGLSGDHWFGIEPLTGRDLFSIAVLGLRTSLFIAIVVTFVTTVVGTLVGISAAYFGGWYDAVVSRLLDFLFGFPSLLFMIALGIIVPAGFPRWLLLIIVLSVFGWAGLARLIRNQARSLVEREFVEAARSSGSSGWHIVSRELLPNLLGPVLVIATMAVPGIIGAEAGLSFLGVGVPPPTPSLGRSISDSIVWVYTGADPWFLAFPGAMLFLAVLGFTLLGDSVRDAFDVRLRRTH
ncbi:peptide/nickel transport system permease protein [Kribbella voronezhensis]|uniref:Peptide/nickel transport system permease protein n=1 Tax=Kribbella voronezhensis TaxID=2512212 RepID=A0A4R7T5V9_9ACTN|nr:ABC transporter permease [Kribbella voronezhensis]TDU86616.1 peptide/nickel transport system permease protein [Kribbella voronezhensis]